MCEQLEIPGESRRWVLKRHRILGKGSFGCATLYEEVDAPGRFVVVKDINMQTMKKNEEVKSFEMEVEILRRSRGHPNIVHFLDYYHDGAFMIYIVMEYCAGGDLGQLEEQMQYRASHQPERFVASILIQMLAGLYYLHVDQHTLHRDIKPQNVFLCSDGALRIGDFGVSTVLDQYGARAKAVCGSPFYMAPELCEERAYDSKADLWSLGVMMYELMALERPFNAVSVPALTRQITRGVFNPIPRDLPYSAPLVEMVESFLQTSPAARPTLRRVLRSAYVRSHLDCVPPSCLASTHYAQLFGEELLQEVVRSPEAAPTATCIATTAGSSNTACLQAVPREQGKKDRGDYASGSHAHKEVNELEMWLESNGAAADALPNPEPSRLESMSNKSQIPRRLREMR
ncbi:protein kinase [Trypanosoma rangeli SC58]|uniref:non-specific serine/threonine protein kinase n=1 Tax=Trypanosoma rangeli SC58 TaxID=429131 RepID=A0A061J4C4_TRYRA|nr:protein kinase [Trypanosoma rangeli SC58]